LKRILALSGLWMALGACEKVQPPAAEGGTPAKLETVRPSSGGEMVKLPGGTFAPFYIDRTPVTQEMFEKVMGRNPSKHKGAQNPVEQTRWTQAAEFCNRCSAMEGLKPCYDPVTWACDFEADGYRLPTEAEWEYACRAGATTRYAFGDDPAELGAYAWFKHNAEGRTHPVGQKAPNAWGLYDMHGNVWQWCNDWYDEDATASGPSENPRGPPTGKFRVLRGGAWDSPAERCTASWRHKEVPNFPDACIGADSYGFRRVRRVGGVPKAAAALPPIAPTPEAPEPTPPAAPASTPGGLDPTTLRGTLVFVSDRAGALDIWTMHASGRDQKPLTRDEHPDADPRFSPDGKQILYTSARRGIPELWIMNRDGSGARRLAEGRQPAWSPDGASILFIRDNQAFVRDMASGAERRVVPESWERVWSPAWSPDGKSIAVSSRHTGEIGIYCLDPDGGSIKPLPIGEQACTPCWSPDGKKIVCQNTRGHLLSIGADGSGAEPITFGTLVEHDPRFSPDGTMIVFSQGRSERGPWQIRVMKLDDERMVELTREGSNSLPDWSPREP
jgi:formylglycine-generating enzyme required for sulfatase activity